MEIITNKKDIKRVKTYIDGLDENLQGGIPEGHIVLVSGRSGTMKSSVAFNILYNEALNGNVVLYLTLEQSAESLIKNMVNLDFDVSKVNLQILLDSSEIEKTIKSIKSSKKGSLIIADMGAIRKKTKTTKFYSNTVWLEAIQNLLVKISDIKCNLFVLDSLSALYILSNFDNPRTKLFYIFEFFKGINLTSFLISESPPEKEKFSEFGVEEYLADGIIRLQATERYRKVTREISIAKMRATDCNLDIFTLEYKNKKFYALYGGKTPVV
ncbi:hypothetical protein HYX01_03450 [Candidatus Woesearchaeota archaeon]|nr:hypothetical protein [Candidatus Woesearchaeota archaeon]